MRTPLGEKCSCGKGLTLVGSPSSDYYTICECNKVGYFDATKGNEINNQSQFDWVTSDSFIINKK
jgi:hypothetical protein|tara:strand:- start:362 stop:556 length:195 start_codon:yes stop_codon:yes gene_type:complete